MIYKRFLKREEGQGLVEYALILVLVAIVVIAVLLTLGPEVGRVFSQVNAALKGESMGVFISFSPTIQNVGGPVYKLTVNVTVSTQSDVTLKASGNSKTKNCNTSCTLSVQGPSVPPSGSFTLSAVAGGNISGSY